MASRSPVIINTVIAGTIAAALLGVMLYLAHTDSGDPIIRQNSVEDVREALNLMLNAQESLIGIITASFGATTFLVSFQREQSAAVSRASWGLLLSGLILLAGALIVAFGGRELLLSQVQNNAVDINVPALTFGRWAIYGCLVGAAVTIGSFAIEVMRATAAVTHQGGSR